MVFSVFLLANSFAQSSFGLSGYDNISEWGSFGITGSGNFSHPQFIAVDDDGSIYVTDLGNKRVQKLSSNGEYITEWGKSGKQP
jgi:DNA-binding beta-propeller fold protein YncE